MKNLFPTLVEEAVLAGATVEVWFSEGARTPAEAHKRGYLRLGNIAGLTPQIEQQGIDTFFAVRGKRRLAKHTETMLRRSYQLDNNVLDLTALAIEYRGDKATGFTQAALAAQEVDAMEFTAEEPSIANKGYPILYSGARVRHVTTVTIEDSTEAALTEGTDFEVDTLHGMIFFLTEQTDTLTITVTADEIDEDSELFENAITPDAVGTREGYASIYIYDQYEPNRIHHRHEDFSCLIRPQPPTQRDSDTEEARTQFILEQTTDPGTVYVRRANALAPYPEE